MKPDVDWIKFLYLMEGQCEPEFSEYEVTETLVRRADIDPDLWHEVEMTGTLRVNSANQEREMSWTDTEADIARTMSGWRVTQRESELHFPCFPSEVKRWAESQFLDVGQELEDACNDEVRERLTEGAAADQKLNREESPIKGDLQVSTAWDREKGRCVFSFYHPEEVLEPTFIVDERGVRSLLPDVKEMSSLPLTDEEKISLEEALACNLTWPASLNQVRAWDERMGYEMEVTGTELGPSREEIATCKKSRLQEEAILEEIKRQGLDPMDLHWRSGVPGDKKRIEEALLKRPHLFTCSSFDKAWENLSKKGLIRNSRG